MITGIFGVPRSGKSTCLARCLKKYRKKYDHIYSINIHLLGIPCITKYDFEHYRFKPKTLILWDEISIDYDNRNFKLFSDDAKDSFMLHGHMLMDIIYVTQNYANVDLKVRDFTQELWYMEKSSIPFLSGITHLRRIYRTISISEYTGELVLGYRFCNRLEAIFLRNNIFIIRRFYYKYFDTHELLSLERRPVYEEFGSKDISQTNDFFSSS